MPLGERCSGSAAPTECAWSAGVRGLRDIALELESVEAVHSSTILSFYLLQCFVGMHLDSRCTVPELICERFVGRMAGLSAEARASVRFQRQDGRIGRVITPEFGIRWALRECRDASHMQWSQAAHVSPALSLEEQIVGSAGGGVVKCVGS